MSTDMGLIAKRGKDGQTHASVNDLKTAAALVGVKVLAYDMQKQVLGTADTDAQGQVVIPSDREPFLIVAERGEERAYLKVEDGHSLSLSHFEVQGQETQSGLKGYIYGERGVWRPGDSLYLDFIIEDGLSKLPSGHPVTMELSDPQGQLVSKKI